MLTFVYTGAEGIMTVPEAITAGMRGKQVVLEFSPEWAGLAKTVVFSNGEKSRDVVFRGNPVTIPAEILEEPLKKLTVGVYGVGDQGEVAIPTVRALGPVILPGALPSGEAAEEAVIPLWEQIHAQLGDLSALDTETKESLVAAINEIMEKYGKIMNPDKTLTLEGVAADAGAVGDRFSQFEEAVEEEFRELRAHYKGVFLVEVADGKASHSAGEIREAAEAGMLPAAWGLDAEGAFFGVLTRFREEKALFVYPTVEANTATVKGVEIDGDKNATPYEDYHKNPPAQGGVHGGNVVSYGALGDGTADDTLAFQRALAENRVVYVPGGIYKLSGELRIRGNCELQLNQDTVLEFTQTAGNCISLEMSASIRGHHGLIKVPYGFSGNVINVTTALNEDVTAIEPWSRWDPQWKAGRYITDLNITKHDAKGFCYANQPGDCKGTAIYISADREGTAEKRSTFLWGLDFSGIRIAGAFSYGIRAVNYNDAWNHEMRIAAFICNCEIGVSLEDCNNAYVSAVIQPRYAENTSGTKTGVYAKHGIQLIRSTNADLSGSRVWDWNADGTLWQKGNQWQHIGMYGDCHGTILNCFHYYEETSMDVREQIYTDTPDNLENVTILQELTRKALRLKSEKIAPEETAFIHRSNEAMLLDENIKVMAENVIGLSGGDSETEMVLSDNLLDKSLLTRGQCFYYGGSGYQMVSAGDSWYGFIPLRGAGTYRTKFQASVHSSTEKRIALVNDNNEFVANVTGVQGEIPANDTRNWMDFEFVVTQSHIAAGATKVAFDVWTLYMEQTMIVKDREYPSAYIPYGYVEVATDSGKKQNNVLSGKTAVFLGDSICAGTTVGTDSEYYGYGWAGLIGEANRMDWFNYGKNGGTITHRGADSTCIARIADTAIAEHPDADYVIFEGGCNDADQMRENGLGEISSDYATFDTATFSGALEALILKLVTACPNAKIGYVIPQKMYKGYADYTAKHHIHRKYFDRAVEICRKWGIPVVDIWNGSMLNPKLSTASVYYVEENGQHLTEAGYLAVSPMIEAWMRNMYAPGVVAGGSGVSSWNDLTDKPFRESGNAVLLPKTQFVFDESLGFFYIPGNVEFVLGKTYTVNWNGVDYTTEAVFGQFNGAPLNFLGNPGVVGGQDNGLPFAVGGMEGIVGAIPLDGSASVTVGITGYELKKIPAQFLTVLRHDIYLENPVWNEDSQISLVCDTTELVDTVLSGGLVYVHLKRDGNMAMRMLATMVQPVTYNTESVAMEEALARYVAEYGKENVPFVISCHNAVNTIAVSVNRGE